MNQKERMYTQRLEFLHMYLRNYGLSKFQINSLVVYNPKILQKEEYVRNLERICYVAKANNVDLDQVINNINTQPAILSNKRIVDINFALLGSVGLDKQALENDLSPVCQTPEYLYRKIQVLKMNFACSLDNIIQFSLNSQWKKQLKKYAEPKYSSGVEYEKKKIKVIINEYNQHLSELINSEENKENKEKIR